MADLGKTPYCLNVRHSPSPLHCPSTPFWAHLVPHRWRLSNVWHTVTLFIGAFSSISFYSVRVGPRTMRPGREANSLSVLHASAVTGGVRWPLTPSYLVLIYERTSHHLSLERKKWTYRWPTPLPRISRRELVSISSFEVILSLC